MDARANTPRLPLDNIFHPSDFSAASEIAFAHALKLALAARATLRILHVSANVVDVEWADFPGIRRTLERWGVIPPGSSRSAVAKLGLRPKKILAPGEDPVDATLPYLRRRPADLIVLATHQRDWLGRWSHKAVAEPVARRSGAMTLFVPHEGKGFISVEDGSVGLKRILIPIDKEPRPQAAVDAAAGLALALGCGEVFFTLAHVGDARDMPALLAPRHEGWKWDWTVRRGNVVEQILQAETACSADLIALTMRRHQGFLSALRGSTSERILRGAHCPVLTIPST